MRKIFLILLVSMSLFASTQKVQWTDSFKDAVATATLQDKPILFIISAHDCPYCHLLENTTLSNPKVIKELNEHFVSYVTYLEDHKPFPKQFFRPATPTIWFLYDDGKALSEPVMGAVNAKNFLKILALVEKQFNKVKKRDAVQYMEKRL